MKSNIWAKTLLTVYPYLVKIADAIDRMVERKALNSFYVTSSDFLKNNVYDVVDKILELSERKVVLINIKILVEDCLKECDKLHAKLLIAKYISKKKSCEISSLLSMPTRTYFRKIKLAENEFEHNLSKLGFDSIKLNNYLKNEEWIIAIKEELLSLKNDKTIIIDSYKLKKKVAL